jgi:sec-independent protein translocase protein TatA
MGLDNPLHIAFLLLLLLLVFGAKRLPEMGRSLGEGLRGFKSSLDGERMTSALAAPVATPPTQNPTPAALVATREQNPTWAVQEQNPAPATHDPMPPTQDPQVVRPVAEVPPSTPVHP